MVKRLGQEFVIQGKTWVRIRCLSLICKSVYIDCRHESGTDGMLLHWSHRQVEEMDFVGQISFPWFAINCCRSDCQTPIRQIGRAHV